MVLIAVSGSDFFFFILSLPFTEDRVRCVALLPNEPLPSSAWLARMNPRRFKRAAHLVKCAIDVRKMTQSLDSVQVCAPYAHTPVALPLP